MSAEQTPPSAARQMLHFLRGTFVSLRRVTARTRDRSNRRSGLSYSASEAFEDAAQELMEATTVPPVPPHLAGATPDSHCPLLPVDNEDGMLESVIRVVSPDAPPPLPPRPSSIDNQCDQQCGPHGHGGHGLGQEVPVEVTADPFAVKHRQPEGPEDRAAQILGAVERDIFRMANQVAVEPPLASSTSTFSSSPMAARGPYMVRSDSWEFSSQPSRGSGCQLNEGFEDSDDTVSADGEAAGTASGVGDVLQEGEVGDARRARRARRRPRSMAGDASSATLARCRQWANQARRSLRVGRAARPLSCFVNPTGPGAEDAPHVGPLPCDSSSFFHRVPDAPSSAAGATPSAASSTAAFERSSLVEPQRQWSTDWTAAFRNRPHSVALCRAAHRADSHEGCSSCGTDDIDWSWVHEEEALQRQQQQQEAPESPPCKSPGQDTARTAPSPLPSSRAPTTVTAALGPLEPLESRAACDAASAASAASASAGSAAMQEGRAARVGARVGAAEGPQGVQGLQGGTANWSFQCDDEDEADAEDDAVVSPHRGPSGGPAARPSSWLRASMRRVRHFRLADLQRGQRPQSALQGAVQGALQGEAPRAEQRRSAPPDVAVPLPHLPASTAAVLLSEAPVVPVAPRPRSAPAAARQCGRAASRPCSRTVLRRSQDRLSATPRSLDLSTSSSSSSSSDVAVPTASPARGSASRSHSDTRSCEVMPEGAQGASPLGQWPHNLSATLACLGCTVGLFNISRFAVLSVQFGANFIIQFLLLSAVFGVPLYTFQVCLGQFLAAGAVDMWRISPVFQGVGIALLVSQALIGVYSTVGVSWIFIYFRDSFITKQDRYRWAEPFDLYREDQRIYYNATPNLAQTVPDYLNGVVLQRHNLAQPENSFGHIKFQVAFNLAVVWMIVFVSLSKGLRSYGKVVYVFSVVPVFGMLVLCTKMLGLMPRDAHHEVFPETEWSEFFTNSNCWVAATTEVFMTWGLLGTAAMQIASHNKQKKFLQRDSSLVIVFTVSMLLLAAFLANMCVALLMANGFRYEPSSFERMSTYQFLQPTDRYQIPTLYSSTPVRLMSHASYVMGERVQKLGTNAAQESGYQVLRLATELVPATLALLGADQVSPFWAVLFYFVLILFGIAQQLAIWHCVITGIMAINAQNLKSWETTITFFSCACGFILGLPMTTELGIFVVYFLDYCVSSGWWLMSLHLLQVGAVLVVRGRPYSGENIAGALFHKATSCLIAWAAPMLTFTWNVILPVILMVVCITAFKRGGSRELYSWHVSLGYDYWPLWARELGAMLQLLPILTVPVVAVVQTCRYLSSGPPDIFDRIVMLYRPPAGGDGGDPSTQTDTPATPGASAAASQENPVVEDPPPKYTPPPSYTTATGARIAKLLRQSFRRSVRRIQMAVSSVGSSGHGSLPEAWTEHRGAVADAAPDPAPSPAPPDYAAVLVEISQASLHDVTIVVDEDAADAAVDDAVVSVAAGTAQEAATSRADEFLRPTAPLGGHQRTHSSALTAADVASVLRCSVRRPAGSAGNPATRSQSLCVTRTPQRAPSPISTPTPDANVDQDTDSKTCVGGALDFGATASCSSREDTGDKERPSETVGVGSEEEEDEDGSMV